MRTYLFTLLLTLAVGSALPVCASETTGNCLSFRQEGRSVTFACDDQSILQLYLCSPSVVRVWYAPDGQARRDNPSFAVVNEDLEPVGDIRVDEQASCYEFYTAKLRIRVNKAPLSLQIFDKYQKLVFGDYADQGHLSQGSAKTEWKTLRADEHIFGLGEKSGKLDRRGSTYAMWNSDKPCYSVNEDPLYKSIPFFMSNYRYGIFLDNTYRTTFDFGATHPDRYSFAAPDGAMVYYFIFGRDYKEIIGQYTALTGQPIMPPRWALGFAQCRGLLTSERLSLDIAEGYRRRGIPCDVIYQDIGWTQHLQDFEWRKGNYVQPREMLDKLKAMGFKVVVSQDPVISQGNRRQWAEADSLGYFVKDSLTGKSYDMPWPWGGNCGVVDFTLPAVADWWGAYQQKPLDDGVAGFWTDMGEPAWSNEEQTERLAMRHHLGTHAEIHNVYGLTWDKVVTEQFMKRNPNRRPFQMTRAAFAGLQRYTFGWTGDSGNSDLLEGWGQLANQLPVLLSAGLGLIPFVTTDISGYCGDISDYPAAAELYTRWLQLGAFNPLSRIHHEGDNAVEPWLFGDEAERNAKAAIERKYRLLPYIYTYAREAHDTGLPLMRPLFLEYPADERTFETDGQFMFGSELLVAPVLAKGARAKRLYLPEGTWIDYNDKRTAHAGGDWITVDAPLSVTPIFVRQGSIVPLMPVMNYTDERSAYPVTFEIFPATEGDEATFTLYEDQGTDLGYLRDEFLRTPVGCLTTAKGYTLTIGARQGQGYTPPSARDFIFRLYTDRKPKTILVDGVKVKRPKQAEPGVLQLTLPDDGQPHTVSIECPAHS
ncbi:MAG: DUF4968 domain-containing protein [Mediterranea sp.]|jgi:alpha-glucosidase|nr:DUF4968 domain-containing protein [Mediterranea sp.]